MSYCKYEASCFYTHGGHPVVCPLGDFFIQNFLPNYPDEDYKKCIKVCQANTWIEQNDHVFRYKFQG